MSVRAVTVTAMTQNPPDAPRDPGRRDAAPVLEAPPRVALDASQRAVLDAPADESLAVLGAPGSGKTTTLVELLAHRVASGTAAPDGVLALAPGRMQATALRDRLAARIGGTVGSVRARTPQSLAFEIVREQRSAEGGIPPMLRTGADDDALIGQLIEGRCDAGGAGAAAWFGFEPPVTDEVMRLGGFRDEMRALIAAMNEYDVTPGELASLAGRRPAWRGAAALAGEFAEVADLDRPGSVDVSELLLEAASAVHAERARDRLPIDAVRIVAVDDAQELTEAARRLLAALEARGMTIVTFGDPDVATGVFRGGGAERATGWRPSDAPAPRRLLLSTVHRHGEGLRSLVAETTGRIGVRGEGRHRAAASGAPPGAACSVRTALASSPVDEARAVAAWLRRRHLEDGVAWGDMAVILRSTGAIGSLARLLARGEVPTTAVRAADPADDPAVQAIVSLAVAAANPGSITGELVTSALESPLFGVDALRIRQLRRALRLREHETGGRRSADDLLVAAVTARRGDAGLGAAEGEWADPLGGRLPSRHTALAGLRRLAGVLRVAGEAAAAGAIDEVLWAVWEGAGVAESWRARALRGGAEGEAVDARLDAVVALFDEAKRVVERAPSTSIDGFAETWRQRRVTADSLGRRADRDAVTLATPASVVGREFRAVAITGVNDGAWPNLRIRDSLLGAQHLVEVVTGNDDDRSIVDRRREVLDDESRMFAQALSRAREHVLVTAIDDGDTQPSVLFRRLDAERIDLDELRLPSTLRELTGRLRSRSRRLAAEGTPPRDEAAALARLAAHGVDGAHPDDWQGLRGWSTTRSLVELPVAPMAASSAGDDDAPERAGEPAVLRVRPSQIDRFDECGIEWFVESHGGGGTSPAMRLGTIVHSSVEFAFPSAAARRDYVGGRLRELEPQSTWEAAGLERRMTAMLGAVERYLEGCALAGVRVIGAERPFTVEVPVAELGAVVRMTGTIDRIEADASGEVVVVDLKTGSKTPTAAETAEHAQLLAYQLAVRVGTIGDARTGAEEPPAPPFDDGSAVELEAATGGARLVFVGTGAVQRRDQTAMTDEVERSFAQRLIRVALGMAGLETPPGEPIDRIDVDRPAAFVATPDVHCEAGFSGARACRIHTVAEVTE